MNEIYEIDTEIIKQTANDISSLTKEFQTLIEALKTRINQINSVSFEWEGRSANNFVKITNRQLDELYPFINMLMDYSKEINLEALQYDQTVNELWRNL